MPAACQREGVPGPNLAACLPRAFFEASCQVASAQPTLLPMLPACSACCCRSAVRDNVAALSSALLVCMVVPWAFCLASFTGGHSLNDAWA